MRNLSTEEVRECRRRLLETKSQLLTQLFSAKRDLAESRDFKGDEADQTSSLLTENQLFIHSTRIRSILLEVEMALARIEKGVYGFCEETEEPIEIARLLAIPWTRYSIEGAEIKESAQR